MKLITGMPKAENHIHIEGSIPWDLALRLAEKNKVKLPATTEQGVREWVNKAMEEHGLAGFMYCNRTINSVCLHEEDYMEVIVALAKDAYLQNVIYQELHLDYPLNEQRGMPIEVVMEGYRAGQKKARELYGVEIVYIAGLDRTMSSEQCLSFVRKLENYLDMVDGLGMDCEERGNPPERHVESYKLAKDMGLFLTAHAGEELGPEAIWTALKELKVDRIDHGLSSVEDPSLLEYLADNKILCACCPTANVYTLEADSYENHQVTKMMRAGIPVSISSDDPPYMIDLVQEYATTIEKMGFTEDELIGCARNAFAYSIKGDKYLGLFDKWIEDFYRNEKIAEEFAHVR